VYRLPEPIVLREHEDADRFTRLYGAWLDELQRTFCIRGDASCAQWHRLFRLPHSTRDEGGEPERLEVLGDPTQIGVWESAWTLDDFRPKSIRAGSADYTGNGILFTLFGQAGMLGQQIRPGVWRIACPQEHRHTRGKRFDGSTILYAAAPGHIWGHVHCSHAHCVGMKMEDFCEVR
jgi:hypothetical protein